MPDYFYDLHIHTALSPCGDDDMSPCNIAGMARLKELEIIAVTDHNSCLNCRAVMEAGEIAGIFVLPGMELQTAEDIHVVCLFSDIDSAERFSDYVFAHMLHIGNRTDIFGYQRVLNSSDAETRQIDSLYLVATDISIDEAASVVGKFDGICYPAHIDREENGILAVLGTIDSSLGFELVELKGAINPTGYMHIRSSDAHYLQDISERSAYVTVDLPRPESPFCGDGVRFAKEVLQSLVTGRTGSI